MASEREALQIGTSVIARTEERKNTINLVV